MQVQSKQKICRTRRRFAGIHQQILVARPTQRAIVLGKGGTRIKAIGEAARTELAKLMGVRVHLYLHVKVHAKWDEDRSIYRRHWS